MKTIFIDTETTGTDPKAHAIIQIAALIEIDGEEVDQWSATMRPHDGAFIDPNALKVNGCTEEEMRGFAAPIDVCDQFINLMARYVDRYDRNDKLQVVGYNVRFDLDMIDAWVRRCGESFLWSYLGPYPVDPLPLLAHLRYLGLISVPNFKLTTIAEALGVPIDNAHDALADIKMTRAVLRKLHQLYVGARFTK